MNSSSGHLAPFYLCVLNNIINYSVRFFNVYFTDLYHNVIIGEELITNRFILQIYTGLRGAAKDSGNLQNCGQHKQFQICPEQCLLH